jgi:uncharacterized protein YbjT (DUF2867 family)
MILVTGATGTVGAALCLELARAGLAVRALTHGEHPTDRLREAGVELAPGDLDVRSSLATPLHGVDRVYLITPASPALARREAVLIEEAERAGVRRIVKQSVMGADSEPDVRLCGQHLEAEQRLRAARVGWTILRPASFMSNLLALAPSVRDEGRLYAPAGDGKIGFIDPADLAATARAVLTRAGDENKVYELTGPESLSYADIAQRLAAVAGRPVMHVDLREIDARAAMLARGASPWIVEAVLELFRVQRSGRTNRVSPNVRAIVGRPPRSLAAFLADHAGAFRSAEQPAPTP